MNPTTNNNKKVFIYSIPRETASRINDWVNDSSGKKLKKTKIGRCTDVVQALYNSKIGGLANYISYTPVTDPITGQAVKNPDGSVRMLQQEMEEKYGKPKGFFTNRPWRKGDSLLDENLTYFQTKGWRLNDGSTCLDMNLMDDELGYYVMLELQLVANSEKEWREHKWPKAQYYIAIENEDEQIKYQKNALKTQTFAKLHASEFTELDKIKFIGILEIAQTRAVMNQETIHNMLFNYIDNSTFEPNSNINKFNKLYTLLTMPNGRKELDARYVLQQALELRIVYEKQGTYTWIRPKGKMDIGSRYEDAVSFLMDPKKDIEQKELLEQIAAKL